MELRELREIIKKSIQDKDYEKTLTEGDYKKFLPILENIDKSSPLELGKDELGAFYYNACRRFDRWTPPTPFVVGPEYRKFFDSYYLKLAELEVGIENLAQFEIDKIKWDLFDSLHLRIVDVNQINLKNKEEFYERIQLVENLVTDFDLPQVKKSIEDCRLIIESLVNLSLVTIIKTKIPVSPIKKKTVVFSSWKGVPIRVFFNPIWGDIPQSIARIKPDHTVSMPMTLSQWQHSYCEVIIEIDCLIDPCAESPALSAHPTEKIPFEYWPYMFNCTFDILDKVTWKIRNLFKISGKWMLLPNDLATHTYELFAENQIIHWIIKDPPGLLTMVSNEKNDKFEKIELDISSDIEWHIKCSLLAHSFLESGASNEALFWINVATEALFEQRSKEICDNNNINYDELSSGRTYWLDAKELISSKFPEIISEIEWPESNIGIPSWYKKIKYLSQKVILKESVINLNKHYSNVQRYRNSLFHGATKKRIAFEEAMKAFDSFKWLESNFKVINRASNING